MSDNETKTIEQIVRDGNALARAFYRSSGCEVADDFEFYLSGHPQEYGCWVQACIAYEHIEGTDLDDCLAEWLDGQQSDSDEPDNPTRTNL